MRERYPGMGERSGPPVPARVQQSNNPLQNREPGESTLWDRDPQGYRSAPPKSELWDRDPMSYRSGPPPPDRMPRESNPPDRDYPSYRSGPPAPESSSSVLTYILAVALMGLSGGVGVIFVLHLRHSVGAAGYVKF